MVDKIPPLYVRWFVSDRPPLRNSITRKDAKLRDYDERREKTDKRRLQKYWLTTQYSVSCAVSIELDHFLAHRYTIHSLLGFFN